MMDSFDPSASSLGEDVDPAVMHELLQIRSSIDNFDATLVYVLAERFRATQRVGVLKAEHRLPPADPTRESMQIARLRRLAEEAHLDPAFAEKFLTFIIEEVIRHHQAISDGTSPLPVIPRPGATTDVRGTADADTRA
ncbi:chorismate mutase [Tersicoccus sp. MR15.9]|uniref:chorismate mutase n=1 Tax=Tersicoccus mangrovi TaxID=3121635 RepID=UPI002FE6BD73